MQSILCLHVNRHCDSYIHVWLRLAWSTEVKVNRGAGSFTRKIYGPTIGKQSRFVGQDVWNNIWARVVVGGEIILLKVFSTIYTQLKHLVNCGQRIGLLSLCEPIRRQLGSILARKTAVQITAHLRKDPFQPFKPRNYQFSPLWCIQLPPLL